MQVSNRVTTATAVAGLFYLGLATAPAFASGGALQGLNAPLRTQATDVPCAVAVHQVLPPGWRVDLPGTPRLCSSISWRRADTPLQVYERIAGRTGLYVVADIGSKTVTIGSRTTLGEARGAGGAIKPKGPQAFVDTSVRAPLSAMAARYGLTLQCAAACDQALPGPVTLELSGDIGRDALLLEEALGPLEPLRIIEDPVTHTLSARLARQSSFSVELPRPKPWWKRWF